MTKIATRTRALLAHARSGSLLSRLRFGQAWRSLPDLGQSTQPNHSARRLNTLWAGMTQCSTYLEVGVQRGFTLAHVKVPFKWAVDPLPLFRVDRIVPGLIVSPVVSDAFFATLPPGLRFDLVFLDGLHEWSQTYRDLLNALNHTGPRAFILIDDVVPTDAISAIPDEAESLRRRRESGSDDVRWHGDVFKILLAIREHHPELDFAVIEKTPGEDNPQALVWRTEDSSATYDLAVVEQLVKTYEQVSYEDVFASGIPPAFRPATEAEVIRRGLEAINR